MKKVWNRYNGDDYIKLETSWTWTRVGLGFEIYAMPLHTPGFWRTVSFVFWGFVVTVEWISNGFRGQHRAA